MNISQSVKPSFYKSLSKINSRKDFVYILITVLALVAFEAFNFSTTDFALSDLLGDLQFAGVRWATLLSIAFCGIDFAGIARLFAPQNKMEQNRTEWYLFSAWFLAATMNTLLTWWGVLMAMQTHAVLSAGIVDADLITKSVPIFIALMVWVIRILLIGTLSKNSDKLIGEYIKDQGAPMSRRELRQAQSRAAHPKAEVQRSVPVGFRGISNKKGSKTQSNYRPEPKYIPMQDEPLYPSMKASGQSQHRR
jgi:hypothetical protein